MRGLALVLMLIAMVPLAGCAEMYRGAVILSGSHYFAPGEVLHGDLLVAGGELVLAEGSVVNGTAYLVGGNARLDGEVTGDVSAIGGSQSFGPRSRIGGTLNVAGTPEIAPGATVVGGVNTGAELPDEIGGEVAARSNQNRLIWMLPEAIGVALLGYLVARLVPRPLTRVGRALRGHWLASAAMGTLTAMVLPAALVMMAFTIFLIPLTILGLVALALTVVYGWIGFGLVLGPEVARLVRRDPPFRWRVAAGTFVFMILVEVAAFVPWLGGLVGILAAITGLGAVALTRYGLSEFVPSDDL